jgi:hypothetical protein
MADRGNSTGMYNITSDTHSALAIAPGFAYGSQLILLSKMYPKI